jgi:O-antigen/teichoic acid export membrane protein
MSPAAAEQVGQSLVRQFRSRSAVYFAADFLVKVLVGVMFLLTVQTLGPAQFGRLSRVAALLGVAASLGDFGLATLLLRRVGGLGASGVLPAEERRRFLLLRTGLAVVAVLGCLAYFAAVGAPDDAMAAAVGGGIGVLVRGYPELVGSALRGQGRTRPDFYVRIVSGVAFVAAALFVVLGGYGVAGFGAAWLVSAVVAALAARVASMGSEPPPPAQAEAWDVRAIVRGALPYAVLSICVMIYFRIDTEMVARMRGDADAGIYGTAYRLFEVCLLLPGAASAALIPLFAGAFENGRTDEVRRLAAEGCRGMAFLGGLGAVAAYSLGPLAIELVLRSDVAAAADVFRVLVWTVPVIFVSCVTSSLIAASGFNQANTRIAIVMVVENVLLNLVAIPRWGPAGAGAATVLTEATGLAINLVVVHRRVGAFDIVPTLGRLVAALAAGAGASLALPGWWAPLGGAAAFAAAWYVAAFVARPARTASA